MPATQPLSIGQKMLAQRLLASHCLSESECHAIWEEWNANLAQVQGIEVGRATLSFDRCVAEINQQMKPGFGLEIRAVGLPSSQDNNINNKNNKNSSNTNSNSNNKNKIKMVKYYAIVNSFPDDIVTKCFGKKLTQVEHNYLHRVLCKLVADADASSDNNENDPDDKDSDQEDDDDDDDQGSGRSTTLVTLLNLRTEMPEAQRVTLAQAEATMKQLLEEKWLVATTTTTDTSSSSSKNSNNNNNNQKKYKRGNKTAIQLGARAYMELSHYLVEECGMEKDDLPPLITFG